MLYGRFYYIRISFMSVQVAIIDYGMGNLGSLKNKLSRLAVTSIITSNFKEITQSDKIILPGIGHYGKAMDSLKKLNLIDVLNKEVLINKKPVLGICLGMQLMGKRSEEGNVDGLGWIDGETVKFNVKNRFKYKIPHVSWNQIEIIKKSNLMHNIANLSEFYFTHSYHFSVNNAEDILNETDYEYRFVSAIEKNNIYGVQYHPEKSYDSGSTLLKNFITL